MWSGARVAAATAARTSSRWSRTPAVHSTLQADQGIQFTGRDGRKPQDISLRNNIFDDAGPFAIRADYAPTGWDADTNVFDPDTKFVWDGDI